MRGEPHRFFCLITGHPADLEQNPSLLHDRNEMIHCPLAAAHWNFIAFFGDGFIREDAYPNFSPALNVSRHGAARGLDLPAGHPAIFERADAKISESQIVAGGGDPFGMTAVVFAVFKFFRYQHCFVKIVV